MSNYEYNKTTDSPAHQTSAFLSVCECVSFYLSTYISVYLSLYLLICLTISLSVCLSTCLSVCLTTSLSVVKVAIYITYALLPILSFILYHLTVYLSRKSTIGFHLNVSN